MTSLQKDKVQTLSRDDFARYLRRLSRLEDDLKTGNPVLATLLSKLARAVEVGTEDAFVAFMAEVKENGASRQRGIPERMLTPEYKAMPLEEVLSVLEVAPRKDLITLGQTRFGISRAFLDRLSRERIIQAIRDAATNEQSLHVISDMAQQIGTRRLS